VRVRPSEYEARCLWCGFTFYGTVSAVQGMIADHHREVHEGGLKP